MTQKHDISHGDLIRVEGYADRPFFVDSWTIETICLPDVTYSETWFDITCAWTGEYMRAELSDIKRICGADQADDYLRNCYEQRSEKIGNTWEVTMDHKWVGKMFGYEPFEPKRKQPSRNPELERQREDERMKKQVDKLLDDYIDSKTLEEILPEDAEKYREQAEETLGRLAKFTE